MAPFREYCRNEDYSFAFKPLVNSSFCPLIHAHTNLIADIIWGCQSCYQPFSAASHVYLTIQQHTQLAYQLANDFLTLSSVCCCVAQPLHISTQCLQIHYFISHHQQCLDSMGVGGNLSCCF